MCAVRCVPASTVFMGLTIGDYVVVLSPVQRDENGNARALCCKYWSSKSVGAITDYGYCELASLENQRLTDHHLALYYAMTTGDFMGLWGPEFEIGLRATIRAR